MESCPDVAGCHSLCIPVHARHRTILALNRRSVERRRIFPPAVVETRELSRPVIRHRGRVVWGMESLSLWKPSRQAPIREGTVWYKNRDLDFLCKVQFDKQSLPDQENFFNIFQGIDKTSRRDGRGDFVEENKTRPSLTASSHHAPPLLPLLPSLPPGPGRSECLIPSLRLRPRPPFPLRPRPRRPWPALVCLTGGRVHAVLPSPMSQDPVLSFP